MTEILAIVIASLLYGNVAHYKAPETVRVEAVVTAYTSSSDETDEDPAVTASGENAGPGSIACPDRLSFGTKVEVAGRILICNDRMHKRYRDKEHYDIWMASKEEAREWGRRQLAISIYE